MSTSITAVALPTLSPSNVDYIQARLADAMHVVLNRTSIPARLVALGQFLAYTDSLFVLNCITTETYREYHDFYDLHLASLTR